MDTRKRLRRLGLRLDVVENVVRESESRLSALGRCVTARNAVIFAFGQTRKEMRDRLAEFKRELEELHGLFDDLSLALDASKETIPSAIVDRMVTERSFRAAVEQLVAPIIEEALARQWGKGVDVDERLVKLAERRGAARARLAKQDLSPEARKDLLDQAVAIGAVSAAQAEAYRAEHDLDHPPLHAVEAS